MNNSVIKDSFGNALVCYHGSEEDIKTFRDQPTYFTSRKDYRYIEKSSVVYPCYVNIEKPYYVDRVSEIESLRTNTDKVKVLQNLGFDGVVYSMPGDMSKGYTGWGDDCPQFVCFKSSQIINAITHPMPKVNNYESVYQKSIIKDSKGKKLKRYHSTKDFFHNFEVSKDIGFHMGSKKASFDRFKQGFAPEFKVVTIDAFEPSDKLLNVIKLSESDNLTIKAFNLLLRKIKYPKENLKEIISSMNDSELLDLISEYENVSDNDAFKEVSSRLSSKETYALYCNDIEIGVFESKIHAKAAIKTAELSLLKSVYIRANNPLRLPDLGLWSAESLIRSDCFNTEDKSSFYTLYDEHEKNKFIINSLKAKGYDAIVYTNEVEGNQEDSFIVFDKEQLIAIPDKISIPKMKCDVEYA